MGLIAEAEKKDVGVNFLSLIPLIRPSHCPFIKISNASQPTPLGIIRIYATAPKGLLI